MAIIKTEDLIIRFNAWMDEARKTEPNDPNAVALATAPPGGCPSVRMVLLKGVDESGFVFYTNLNSRKGGELSANPQAGLCFHWKSLERQIRIEGRVEPVSDAEADAYFASRPKASRIGAWASKQSRALANRFELETRIAVFAAKFKINSVPRPEFWSGFRIIPDRIEFWEARPFRLHDRSVFHRIAGGWETEKLFP